MSADDNANNPTFVNNPDPNPIVEGSLDGEVGDGEAVGSMEEGERIGSRVGDLEAQQGGKAGQTEVLE